MPAATHCSRCVGIAGEDDLDAPDLQDGAPSSGPAADGGVAPIDEPSPLRFPAHTPGSGHGRGRKRSQPQPSSMGRFGCAQLLADIESLPSAEQAATWALWALRRKNSLTAADAKLVEERFEQRLSELSPAAAAATPRRRLRRRGERWRCHDNG